MEFVTTRVARFIPEIRCEHVGNIFYQVMIHVPSKFEWQLMMDYTFIRNRIPENTPAKFRHVHTKGFLQMLHPKVDFKEDTLTCMRKNSPDLPINHAYYKEKVQDASNKIQNKILTSY